MHNATWIEVEGRDIYVEVAGSGQPVLCIHTAGQSGVQYRDVLQRLPSFGYQVVVLDLPGHGRSLPAREGPIEDLHRYAEICWELSQKLSLQEPVVLGCSIGGKIALDLCVNHGRLIKAGVAMEVETYSGSLSVAGLRRSMQDAASPSQGDRTYFGAIASCGVLVSDELVERIAVMHRREDSVVTASDLIGWTTHDLRGQLDKVVCPILIVAGSDDFWIRPERSAEMASLLPSGEFMSLEGIGHYPIEELEDFPELLADWLQRLVSR